MSGLSVNDNLTHWVRYFARSNPTQSLDVCIHKPIYRLDNRPSCYYDLSKSI